MARNSPSARRAPPPSVAGGGLRFVMAVRATLFARHAAAEERRPTPYRTQGSRVWVAEGFARGRGGVRTRCGGGEATSLRHAGVDPVLLKTEMVAGHGGISGRYERWREAAFQYAWVLATADPDHYGRGQTGDLDGASSA